MLRFPVLCALALLLTGAARAQQPRPEPRLEMVRPSEADPSVRAFDDPSVILTPAASTGSTPLVVFLSGTGGRPEQELLILKTVAAQGYRVLGLAYDDTPAVAQVCPQDPDPACSARFREMRVFGRGTAAVSNPPGEAVNRRLVALLQLLDRQHAREGWSGYLSADGRPRWDRMVVSGLSQGAGMAAFIAKRYPVARVVLFSSPWDVTGRDKAPAPWLREPSATPPDRWWAERHVEENTTQLIANAYRALSIPDNHILLFDLPLNNPARRSAPNPYHGSTILNPNYAPLWKQMFGQP